MVQHGDPTHNLSAINEHPSPIAGPHLLHELVAPPSNLTAIDFLASKRRKFSYRSLHTLSNTLCQRIHKSLERLENASSIIPVLLPQCPELYIALLAILKAGKAFCPISLDTPVERLNFILNDISATLIITDSTHNDHLQLSSEIITLNVDHGLFQEEKHDPPITSQINTNNLAYVLYTSGSTGLPKAVSVSHRAVTQSLLAHDRHIPRFARFLQFAAPTFDVSIFEIFFPWYRGRTLVSRSRAQMLDNLPETIRVLDVDAAELTPTVVSNLLEGRSSVPNLKLLLTIGEMLTPDVIEEYGGDHGRDSILWAMYGPTEAAIHCTVQPRLSATASTRMIGYPLDTVSAFVVSFSSGDGPSFNFSILHVGEEGELVVGGLQIAEEYLNRPELTTSSFLHHPTYGYLYRTGDRAKMRTDGTLECLGRVVTGQVKLRGQRVELGEIEHTIMKLQTCRAAAVLVIEEVLVAFCAIGSHEVSHKDVLQICEQWLPAIMVPADVRFIRHMPQLPSGKIDRQSLITMHHSAIHLKGSPTKHMDNVKRHTILNILQQYLHQALELHYNLASVGIDSLQAIRLASALRAKGYQLTALQILSATTVESLLDAAENRELPTETNSHGNLIFASDTNQLAPGIEQWYSRIDCMLPCTPLQEAMLAETVARPKAYCNWIEVELSQSYTFKNIQQALHQMAHNNEILRTGFYPTAKGNETFIQIVWKDLEVSQIQQVNEFSKSYSLGSYESLSRPLSVQVRTNSSRPRILFQIHHTLYDGWSFDLILEDLSALLLHGRENKPRPRFREIVQFYHNCPPVSQSDDARYWATILRDRPENLLPNLNGTIIADTTTQYITGCSQVMLNTLLQRSRELVVSPQVFFQAAIAIVMSSYVGSSDVVIGNVTSGRTIPIVGVEDIIGPCIATLPFRLNLENLTKVRDVLQETQRLNREGLKHVSIPLRQIAKIANARSGSRLFDVLFVWQQSLNSASNSSPSAYIIESADDLEFKATFEFEPQSDHVSFRATFDPSAIPENQIVHLSRQIDEVAQFLLGDADCMIIDIAECFSISSSSIANPTPQKRSSLHGPAHAVEKWALTAPDREALLFSHIVDGVMQVKTVATYAALNHRANQVARALSGHRVCPGDLVGVIMEKSIDLYVTILAVLKLGAGYLPLIPDSPRERTKTILSEARVSVCVVDSSASTHVQEQTSLTFVDLQDIDFTLFSGHNINTPYNGAHVAYCVFTSGSTGVPKGVLITQENLMNNLDYLSRIYPYSSHSRLLQSCSQAFDVSVFEIFFSWYVGICLCSARKDDLFIDLERAICQAKITHLSLTPTVAALIDPDNVPQVQFLVTAGEALTEPVRRKWVGRGLYQGYGPSETTNICTVRPSVVATDLINNIGPPFDNTSAFVLDPKSTNILPRGSVGELCFGGHQVFQGYLNRPEMTAAKIINHPTYGRIYRSGDTGILLHDDSILCIGRLDDQVKIRGQRVELGEISSAVLDQEYVKDCATLLLRRAKGPESLVNFWVPRSGGDASFQVLDLQTYRPDILAIFAAIFHHLPTYMIPRYLIPIAQIPMTTQGKIDKRVLQTCFANLSNEDAERTTNMDDIGGSAPITAAWEIQVARILAETLEIHFEEIGRNSSFFNLGLDSVSAINLSHRLKQARLGHFAISTILKHPTIAHLAAIKDVPVQKLHTTQDRTIHPEEAVIANEIVRIRHSFDEKGTPFSKVLPCTPLQEAMLASESSASGSFYTNVMIFSVHGDLSRLRECWALMVERHEILRTSFVATADPTYAFAQVVLEDISIQWDYINWSHGTHRYANSKISELLENGKPPFWLAIAEGTSCTKMLFCCHHALYDAIAMRNLLNEVQDMYHRRQLPPVLSYDIYLQDMMSQDLKKADRFWKASFQGFEPTSFPNLTHKAQSRARVSASWHQSLLLPLSELRKTCQGRSLSLLSLVLTTWAKLLHFYNGESDVCFGNVVSGRARSGCDLGGLVAPCFNTLPVRIRFDISNSNEALMRQAHAFTVESFAFQLTPLRRIQNLVLEDGRRLFDTLVILQQASEPLDNTIWTLEEDWADIDLPLVCELVQNEAEDKLDLVLHYQNSFLSEADAKIVAETFDASLVALANEPHASASATIRLPPRLRAESRSEVKLLQTDTHFLHSDFESNARTHPQRIALDFLHADGGRTAWSFKTLNEMANGIAHTLINAGVKPEQIVPIHIPKCPLFYASVLGVLKAGAAFAPIHPDLPELRRCFMLKELKSRYILYTKDCPPPDAFTDATLIDIGALQLCEQVNPSIEGLITTNLAYCIFTSGSTGVPKAVSMEHRSPLQTINSSRSLVPHDSSSRLLQYAATSFDMCYYDCFLAWTLGFTLCSAEQDRMTDELAATTNALDVNLLDLTPSVAASLVRRAVPGVKWLFCIGEAMPLAIVKEWQGACVNSYGPTETAFCTSMHPVREGSKTSVIGKPFPSTSFAVFHTDGDQPLPLLSVGELCIGGAQLARGYLGRPDLTNKKFVIMCGQRYYRSGDIVRMLSDGNFEFVGRVDDQVKIRGLRVELSEIDHTFMDSQRIIKTAVTLVLKKTETAKEQLVVFLVSSMRMSEEQREEHRQHLRKIAQDRLPSYMIPHFFLFVDQIPQSLAGKADKTALANIFRHSSGLSLPCDDTLSQIRQHRWTELEIEIRDIFARLSYTAPEDISPATSIYQLGLDSISAVQIAAALRRNRHHATAGDVMKHTSCIRLANFIEQYSKSEQPASVPFDFIAFDIKHRPFVLAKYNIADKDVVSIRPCTPIQRGMISQMIAKDGAVYINHIRLELDTGLSIYSMKQAWEKVMATHTMLRTGFVYLDDKEHPFGMIEYGSGNISLPWDTPTNSDKADSTEVWLAKLQRRAPDEIHRPCWRLRIIANGDVTYLDIAIFHALFDAQSLQCIFNDVSTTYNGGSAEHPTALNPVIDGILQRSNDHSEQGRVFWAQIGEQITPCRFPNLAPLRYTLEPPVVRTFRSTKSLPSIQQACQQVNTTLQAVGIASWLSLISIYTGESRATCGVVLSGRTFDETEHAVFPCINTIPISKIITNDSKELLLEVTALIGEVQQYQHIPLTNIHKLMGCSDEPLFDTIFALQKISTNNEENGLWRIVDENASIEYAITIELEPRRDSLDYRLTFLPHSLPREQAAIILEQLDHLVQSFLFPMNQAGSFDTSLYSMIPAKEPELPCDSQLLHGLVELSAAKHPHRVALEFADSIREGECSVRRWTYSELDVEGNRVANLLITEGVQPGDLVGVCFDKCPEASFAMLGILKAGCAFVAIDPGAPVARQALIVQDSTATAILSMTAQSDRFSHQISVPILNLDTRMTQSYSVNKPTLAQAINTQDRSYCLYTSGTTGIPKGCELSHENAVQALVSFQRLFAGHWDQHSRWLQFASFHFDVSVLEQFWSWSVGICVVSAPRDLIFEDLAKSINTLGITHIDLTPSLAQLLHPCDVPELCKGVFITGGESLKQEILDVWGQTGVIYNGYGPTETTIGCTMYPRVPTNGKPSNIGPQFDNVGTLVLRPGSDVPVLRGGVGELCISGKLVGKGYLNRDDLTKKSFPYLQIIRERVYRTGDLVRLLHDGTFDFLGRADDQVKMRGQRLEIGEINTVIRQSSKSLSDVATMVLRHPQQQKEQLVAFLAKGKGKDLFQVLLNHNEETRRAKEACHEKLPPYMVPTHFVQLTTLPLNVNNKADAKKLKEIYDGLSTADLQNLSASSERTDHVWSSRETKIRNAVSRELGVNEEALNKHTSFFELGMDSISVISVGRAMKHAGFSSATASLIMKHCTVQRLETALSEGLSIGNHASLVAAQQKIIAVQHRHRHAVARSLSVEASDIETLVPCTPIQQGMIARSLERQDGTYFNTFLFELSDCIDHVMLESAWQRAYESTPTLRTMFVNTEDGYIQTIVRDGSLSWTLESRTKNETLGECLTRLKQRWVQSNQNDFSRPFEIISLNASGKHFLVVHIFHALYDGISIELVFRAVRDVYKGRPTINEAPIFHSSLAYGPLRVVEGSKRFWQEHLGRGVVKPLPSLDNNPNSEPCRINREIEITDAFESTRRQLNVTAQAVVQACWLKVLQDWMKAPPTIGVVVSGRSIDLENADRIIGPMFNTIPYEHHAQRGESWASLIKRVHDFHAAAHPYQHAALRDIGRWCKDDRSQPLFNSLFVFQVERAEKEWTNNEGWNLLVGEAEADYPLAFEVEQMSNSRCNLTLVTQSHISDAEVSGALINRFEETVQQAVKDPNSTVGTVEETNEMTENVTQDGKPALNGFTDIRGFSWTHDANIIRETLADLTGNRINDLTESTSIFELGLDSIDAIKMSSKIKNRGVDLPVSGIMRGLTIAKMLDYIKTSDAVRLRASDDTFLISYKLKLRNAVEQQNMNMECTEDVLPLTPLQEAMVAEMVTSEFTRYYNFDVMRLQKNTDIDNLRGAWTRVIQASPILRTCFVEISDPHIDSTFAQVICSKAHNFWTSISMDQEPDFVGLMEQSRKEAKQLFRSEPPFHLLHIIAPGQNYLILSLAHALYDGWSLNMLHADVARAYNGQYLARPDYEEALSKILSTSGQDAASFWKSFLSGSRPCILSPRPGIPLRLSSRSIHRLNYKSMVSPSTLANFAKKTNVSIQALGQSVFAMVLASFARSLDVVFGSILSARDDDTASKLLFPMMNTVAIRAIMHGTHLELIRYMQENLGNIKQWQHFPFRRVLSLAGSRGPMFNSLFIYQRDIESSKEEIGRLYTSVQGQSNVEYPVCVEMEIVRENLIWRCAIQDEVFDEIGSRDWLVRMDKVLNEILEWPENSVIHLSSRGLSLCGLPPFLADDGEKDITSDTAPGQKALGYKPRTETLQSIREILAAVSGTPEHEITTDITIFHIGLDSISAIKVSSLLRKRHIMLSVSEMLQAKNLINMAQIADSNATLIPGDAEDSSSTIKQSFHNIDEEEIIGRAISQGCCIQRSAELQMLPVTGGQLYMLSMWVNTKGNHFYPNFAYRLTGDISFQKLRHAWKDLIKLNPILKACFVTTKDKHLPYVQFIQEEAVSEFSIIETTHKLREQTSLGISQPETGQLWVKLYVMQTSAGWDLELKIHHALYDGVSLPILIQQLQDICNGNLVRVQNNTLPALIASYSKDSVVENRRTFWTTYLADLEQRRLSQPSSICARSEVFIPGMVSTERLNSVARGIGVSVQAIFLAAYAQIYAEITKTPKEHDVIIGTYLANRSIPISGIELAPIPTVNLLPLRIRSPLQQSILDTAHQVQHDLQKIGQVENVSASLYEVSEWTSVKIDTFVNFLKLPDVERVHVAPGEGVEITQKSQWCEKVSRIVDQNTGSKYFDGEVFKFGHEVNGAYLHVVDIEVTIRNGALDIGIFAPVEMLDLAAGNQLLHRLQDKIESL